MLVVRLSVEFRCAERRIDLSLALEERPELVAFLHLAGELRLHLTRQLAERNRGAGLDVVLVRDISGHQREHSSGSERHLLQRRDAAEQLEKIASTLRTLLPVERQTAFD